MPYPIYQGYASGTLTPWHGRLAQDMNLLLDGKDVGPDGRDLLQRFHAGVYCARQKLSAEQMDELSATVSREVLNSHGRVMEWVSLSEGSEKLVEVPRGCTDTPHLYR